MRFAYADPPYLGCAKFYDHPEAERWNDVREHADLIRHLGAGYDGWAFSCSVPSLGPILTELTTQRGLLRERVPAYRIASWVKPFAAFKRNVRIAYTWEPVIFHPGRDSSRDGAPVGRDHLAESITLKKGLTGAKPERFCRWVLDLMGYLPGDQMDDLFPGTGIMGVVTKNYQTVLA